MRVEITKIVAIGDHWEVHIRQPNGHFRYRMLNGCECPDQLSAYMAAQKELDQEEQTNGNNC